MITSKFRMMAQLLDMDRVINELQPGEFLTLREMEERLEIPYKTLYSIERRARLKLKRLFEQRQITEI